MESDNNYLEKPVERNCIPAIQDKSRAYMLSIKSTALYSSHPVEARANMQSIRRTKEGRSVFQPSIAILSSSE
jgi:hypothetical protein